MSSEIYLSNFSDTLVKRMMCSNKRKNETKKRLKNEEEHSKEPDYEEIEEKPNICMAISATRITKALSIFKIPC